jgi:hypothetical protein
MIPIVIICFNNHIYVENMARQIIANTPSYAANIIIMDNASTDLNTRAYLDSTPHRVIRNPSNQGPWINHNYNANVFNILPKRYILTDADLEFNKDMPTNFIDAMEEVMNFTGRWMVGFALKHDDCDIPRIFKAEEPHWQNPLPHPTYQLYSADIDTTFALRDHTGYGGGIRMAGPFVMRHLPWYDEDGVMTTAEKYTLYTSCDRRLSSSANELLARIDEVYVRLDDGTFVRRSK